MTTREPLYTEQDRAELLALAEFRASLCPCGCGLPGEDTTAPEVTGPRWLIQQDTCQARIALLEAQRGATEDRGTANAPARLWSIEMRKR